MKRVWVVIEKNNNRDIPGKIIGVFESPDKIPREIYQQLWDEQKFSKESKLKIMNFSLEEINMMLCNMAYWVRRRFKGAK